MVLILITPLRISAASATLSGPKTVRAGNTINVTFAINGNKISGLQAEITFDSSVLSFNSYTGKLSSKWSNRYSVSGNKITILAVDESGSKTIDSANVAVISFKVKSSVEVGTAFEIKLSGKATNSDGSAKESFSATYSKKIAAPLSSNNSLKALSVKGYKITPNFSSSTTTYNVSVPYEVSSLKISATPSDDKASVSIKNNSLKAGKTTNVSVVVKAQSGAKKTYIIQVKRAADPNYVASADNFISNIVVEEGTISPIFDKDRNDYIVYVPYEITAITINAKTSDKNAKITVNGNSDFKVGTNEIQINCIAENGEVKNYYLNVVRAESYDRNNKGPLPVANEQLLNEIMASQNSKENFTFYLDLSTVANQQVDAVILNRLNDMEYGVLNIDLGRVRVSFNSTDIKNTEAEICDFTLTFDPVNKAKISELLTIKENLIFGVGYSTDGDLGYATFNIVSDLVPGNDYYVYYYDEKQEELILIAAGRMVDEYGHLSFRSDFFGEYVITREKIEGVKNHESVDKQNGIKSAGWWKSFDFNNYQDLAIAGGGATAILLLGVLFGYLGERAKFRRYIKRRSKEAENDGEALL